MPNVAQPDRSSAMANTAKTSRLSPKLTINNSANNLNSTTTPTRGQIYPRSKMWKTSS